VSTQAQVSTCSRDLQDTTGVALIFISHDISVVAQHQPPHRVMNRGRLVEIGDAEQVVTAPKHEYTRTLLASLPARARSHQYKHRPPM
jgi:ABC-type dipeptide/oligopeptide/nickel transport system ATPase component